MSRIVDYQDAGIFPVQDHEGAASIGSRLMMAACRVRERPHPESSQKSSLLQVAAEFGMGTIGDVHPWFYWNPAGRELRPIGMWSMAHSGLTVAGGDGGFGSGHTGRAVKASGLLPFRLGHDTDPRFRMKYPNWPKCFQSIPQGVMMMVMPGTLETAQSEHMLHADPRLLAVHTKGPGEAGTLVCDLQPEGVMCMRGSRNPKDPKMGPVDAEEPGIVGRAARLQSMMRVVPMHVASLAGLQGTGRGNALAWNLAPAGVDRLAGYGICWVIMKAGGQGGGPTTQDPGKIGPKQGGNGQQSTIGGPGSGGTTTESAGGDGPVGGGTANSSNGDNPCGFGEFKAQPQRNQGSAFMAQIPACGPFTGGSGAGDKHYMGNDKDGNPIVSGHLDINAYFHQDEDKDGPLHFEGGTYPNPPKLDLISRVHFVWDPGLPHKWIQGQKQGKWRWYAEYDCVCPDDKPPDKPETPRTPPGPSTPRPTGPSTPGPTNPGGPSTPGPGRPGTGPSTPGPRAPGPAGGGPQTGGPGLPGPTTGGPGVPNPKGPTTHGGAEGPPAPPGPWKGRTYGTPTTGGPGVPKPKGPTTGGPGDPPPPPPPGGPSYGEGKFGWPAGGPGGGGTEVADLGDPEESGTRGDIKIKVGDLVKRRSLYEIFRPITSGFAQLSFRPELTVQGELSFIHNPEAGTDSYYTDELRRPQVIVASVWGDHREGRWNYQRDPDFSPVRGGTVHGGILFRPPHLSLESYFGIKSRIDVRALETISYVTCAPGVAFALGTPKTDGMLNPKSVVIGQNALLANDPFQIYQLTAASVPALLFQGFLDQTTSEVVVEVGRGGNQAVRLPRGTTAQRPVALAPIGGETRFNTDVVAGVDTPEFYDQQLGKWVQHSVGGRTRVVFTATTLFAHRHGFGNGAIAQVQDSSGNQIEVCVDHTDLDTVVLHFTGTLTDAVLILN